MLHRLVLFDIDGTLIDTAGAGRVAIERASRDVLGIDGAGARTGGVRFAGMTDPVILEAIAYALGLDAGQYAAKKDALRRRFLDELKIEMLRVDPRRRVLPGVRRLLATLHGLEHAHLGLLTGNLEEGARIKLEPFGLNDFFDTGGFSSDHHDRREIARIAHEKASDHAGIRFPPGAVTVIGDTELDVDCARANGFVAVAVDTGWVPREELERAAPDTLLDGLGDHDAALEALGLT